MKSIHMIIRKQLNLNQSEVNALNNSGSVGGNIFEYQIELFSLPYDLCHINQIYKDMPVLPFLCSSFHKFPFVGNSLRCGSFSVLSLDLLYSLSN